MASARNGGDAAPVTSLGRLIAEQRRIRGLSLDQVSDLADAAGYKISKQRVWQLENEPLPTWPRAGVIKGLSVALGIPERVLTSALIDSMGLQQSSLPDTDWQLLITKAEQLTPAGLRRLKQQVAALIDINDDDSE